jgi:hypothetical protein
VTNDLATANKTISSLGGNIATLQSDLNSANHTISDLTYLVIFAVAIGLVGIILAAYAVRGKAPWKY